MNYAYQNYLMHWGIKGQKWGIRRFQNEDGTLTEAGRARYQKQLDKDIQKKWWKVHNNVANRSTKEYQKVKDRYRDVDMNKDPTSKRALAYMKEIADLDDKLFKEEANKFFKDNPAWTEEQVSKIPTYGNMRAIYNSYLDRANSKKKKA